MVRNDFNHRLKKVTESPIRAFDNSISHIEGLVKFTLGEPDFNTPEFIRQAAIDGIQHRPNGYTLSQGMLEVRQAAHSFLLRHYELDYDAEDIIISIGATGGLFSAFYTLLNPGDKVLIPTPHYSGHIIQVHLAGGIPILVDVTSDGFVLTPEAIDRAMQEHPDAKVIALNYPSNPTGKSYRASELEALAETIRRHDLWVVSDEIYSELTYDYKPTSIAKFLPERTILINGLSKSHAMTGWRIGLVAGPTDVMSQLFIVHQGAVNAASTQSQYAALAALAVDGDESIEIMKGEYMKRRDYLVQALSNLGYTMPVPDGAFYLFVRIPDWFPGDDMDFCLKLAHEAKIGVTPGQSFGEAGKGYFRISYASSQADLEFLIRTLSDFAKKYKK